MIRVALRVLTEREEKLAAQVFVTERRLNKLQVEVDDTAVKLTALQQPVAGDVWFLFMASRIGGELERIGDQAVNICQNVRYVLAGPPLPEMSDLAVMAGAAERMVRESVGAMRLRDVDLAARVIGSDHEVDDRRDASGCSSAAWRPSRRQRGQRRPWS
jgi:phosphate transport system protein